MKQVSLDFTGKMLIAMPGMGDPRFEHSVVYMCAHSDDGAMGLIVNKPATDIGFADLLEQLGIPVGEGLRDIRVHFGGPVEHGRGFVLHSADYEAETGTMKVDDQVAMTATIEVLEQIAKGEGPASSMLALGYAGWEVGQLEREMRDNAWISLPLDEEILFQMPFEDRWHAVWRQLGVDIGRMSHIAGHA